MEIIEVVAIAIALIALFAVLLDHYRQRRRDRLQLEPALVFHCDTTKGESIRGLWLQNSGLGPARVLGTSLKLDDEYYGPLSANTWARVIQRLGLSRVDWLTMNILPRKTTIAPAERVKVLGLVDSLAPTEFEALLLAILSRLEMRCDYESLCGIQHESEWDSGSDATKGSVLTKLVRRVNERLEDSYELELWRA